MEKSEITPSSSFYEWDLVCTAGGLKAMYLVYLPLFLFENGKVKFIRASGASSGAFCAACALCEVDGSRCVEIYHRERKRVEKTEEIMRPGELLRMFCKELLPEDCHLRCNGRLYISVHVLTATGFEPRVFSEFTSQSDLIDCILASSTIPFVTFPMMYYKFRHHYCIDGIHPESFKDGVREMLCIDLWKVSYDSEHTACVSDQKVHEFSQQGLDHFKEWFVTRRSDPIFSLSQREVEPSWKVRWYCWITRWGVRLIMMWMMYQMCRYWPFVEQWYKLINRVINAIRQIKSSNNYK